MGWILNEILSDFKSTYLQTFSHFWSTFGASIFGVTFIHFLMKFVIGLAKICFFFVLFPANSGWIHRLKLSRFFQPQIRLILKQVLISFWSNFGCFMAVDELEIKLDGLKWVTNWSNLGSCVCLKFCWILNWGLGRFSAKYLTHKLNFFYWSCFMAVDELEIKLDGLNWVHQLIEFWFLCLFEIQWDIKRRFGLIFSQIFDP